MKERYLKILELLSREKRIEVNKLAELLAVSEVTIRKDLTELEKQGLIIREHGFAVLNESDDINQRISRNYHKKQRIVEEAVKAVNDGETIMVESGSCCSLFVKALSESKKDVTVITNSAFIADFVRKNDTLKVILLGGEYQNEAQVLVGPITREILKNFHVDKAYVGIDGYTPETGFTGNNYMRADVVKGMAEQAEELIILSDSSKFGQKSLARLVPDEKVSIIITDEDINSEYLESLREEGIKVMAV